MDSLQQQAFHGQIASSTDNFAVGTSPEGCGISNMHQITALQNQAASLQIQQNISTSQAFVQQIPMQLGGASAMEHPCTSVWTPFSGLSDMNRMQRKAAKKAARLLEANGLTAQQVPPLQQVQVNSGQFGVTDVRNIFLQNGDLTQQSLQQVMRGLPTGPITSTPRTYPYTQNVQRSPRVTPSLSPLLQGSRSCSILSQSAWDQPKPAKRPTLYPPNVSVSPSGIWLSPPSPNMSFSDSALDTLQTPQARVSAHHGCPVTQSNLGGVIPSREVYACKPYIPPKCPETLTEAACMYIDYLIQENENLVHTSHCEFLQPFTKREHREFIHEILKGPCQMPSEKFRAWLKQFNVDVEVVTGEMNSNGEIDEDLEEFDASLFLPDMNSEPPQKESHHPEETNLAHLLPQIVGRTETDGSITIQCIPPEGIVQQDGSVTLADPIPVVSVNPETTTDNATSPLIIPPNLQRQLLELTAAANANAQLHGDPEDENHPLALYNLLENFQNQGMVKTFQEQQVRKELPTIDEQPEINEESLTDESNEWDSSNAESLESPEFQNQEMTKTFQDQQVRKELPTPDEQPEINEESLTDESNEWDSSNAESSESPDESVVGVDKSTQFSSNLREPEIIRQTQDAPIEPSSDKVGNDQPADSPCDLSTGNTVQCDQQDLINNPEKPSSPQISTSNIQLDTAQDTGISEMQEESGEIEKTNGERMQENTTSEPAKESSLSDGK